MEGYELVATVDEFAQTDRKEVVVDEVPVLLIRCDDHFYAIEDACTHDGQPLADGVVEQGPGGSGPVEQGADRHCQIVCSRHGAKFDLVTGEALCMPATEAVSVYDLRVDAGQIWLREK